jgi:hypothetical protein
VPHALRPLLFALGAVWTSPNTVLGLILGLPGLARGAQLRVSDAALVFQRYPWGPGGALTLGQVILNTGTSLDLRCRTYAQRAGFETAQADASVRLGDHERAHVYQYLLLGPLFLPLYALCCGISLRNRFERAADRYAAGAGSWWPWRA